MTKIKFGDKEYQIQFGYIATAKSGIIGKLIKSENALDGDNIEDSIGDFLLLIPELVLVGLQKFHRDEFGYNYDTGEGREEALEKAGDLVDSYFDSEEADITNKQRAEMANASGATVWIRIGVCESTDSEMTGVMAQCISEKNPYHSELYRDSHALATRVLQGITNNIEITNHGIYENDQMVAFNWSEIPVISIDIGFMSNATDEANLVTDWYKETMVKGIADGLDYYFQ